jgi:hypothetical protein
MTNSIEMGASKSIKPGRFSICSGGPFVLLFIILGGLPFYMPALLYLGEVKLLANIPFDWAFWANQAVSMPHVWATYARLSRKVDEGKVHFLYGVPAYFAIVVALAIAAVSGNLLVVMTAVNVWQSYHYLRQVYGVGRFFSRRDAETEQDKRLNFWAYHLAMPIFVLGRWNMLYIYWRGQPSDAIIPVAFPSPLLSCLFILGICALLMGLYGELIKFVRNTRAYDCSGLLNLLVYFVLHWFGFLCPEHFMAGFLAVTIFHAVQYIGIAWYFEAQPGEGKFLPAKILSRMPLPISFSAFWLVVFLIGDLAQSSIFPLGNSFYAKFSLVCLSGITVHHYLVDTFLWGRKIGH